MELEEPLTQDTGVLLRPEESLTQNVVVGVLSEDWKLPKQETVGGRGSGLRGSI